MTEQHPKDEKFWRFKVDLNNHNPHEWWRTDALAPYGQQVSFSSDGGATWETSVLPTVTDFLLDADGNAVEVPAPGGGSGD